eukprot:UN27928
MFVAGRVFLVLNPNSEDVVLMPPKKTAILKEDISIFISTFNCGNAKHPGDVSKWFHTKKFKQELVILGTQENDWEETDDEEKSWIEHLNKYFNKEYVLVSRKSLVEMRLFIYCRRDCVRHISRVCTDTEGTGLLHMHGNKGAVGISFDYRGTSICFINSHLAAHQGEFERRNSDYSEIVESLRLGQMKQEIMADFHYVFWMGDLNYRLDYGNQTEKTPSKE